MNAKRKWKRMVSFALCLMLCLSLIPTTAFAGHRCPDCGTWIDGDPYCSECYKCDSCVAVCSICGICSECSGNEICDGCTANSDGVICMGCIDEENHCPGCNACYFEVGAWCDECGLCYENCTEKCESCSSGIHGSICVNCAIDAGNHCPGCEACYFEVGAWCDECGLCYDNCVDKCETCSDVIHGSICVDCAVDAGFHCPNCGSCYEEGLYCSLCGACENCSDICTDCVSEGICMQCAAEEGYHCRFCWACSSEVTICEDCGEECTGCKDAFCESCSRGPACTQICSNCLELCEDCADAFCENCNLCSNCTEVCENCGNACINCADVFCEDCQLCGNCVDVCPNCGSCSNTADICPNCEERCSECANLCPDCGLCEECCQSAAESEGCDCDEWVCIESGDWDEHFAEVHNGINTLPNTYIAEASTLWSSDESGHWHRCLYCSYEEHFTDAAAHTYGADGKCTVCGYDQNAAIQITRQPEDVTGVYVIAEDMDGYEDNLAHFEVEAVGTGELTYQWYSGHYYNGNFWLLEWGEGPSIDIVIRQDSCNLAENYYCVITDQYGNSVTSNPAAILANHNYGDVVSKNENGHVLECVGDCDAVSTLRKHCDENNDYICDVCGWEMDKIVQQISLTDNGVMASFRVGETEEDFTARVTDALQVESPANTALEISFISLAHHVQDTGYVGMASAGTEKNLINSETKYILNVVVSGTLSNGVQFPSREDVEKTGFLRLNGEVLPASEYTVGRVIQNDTEGKIQLTFYLTPASESVSEKFTDVPADKWYTPYIQSAIDNNFMSGTSDTTFDPNGSTSRAMFVQILYAMAGKPDVTGLTCPFTDVPAGKWYYNAVVWAYNNNVTSGTSATTFGPNDNVTREQVALLLYAYYGRPEVTGELSGFADINQVSSWANTALVWATQNGIMSGSKDGDTLYLQPKNGATRAVTATMMTGFYNLTHK